VADLLDAGFDGAGETIVLLEAYGSPTALQDLRVFDAKWGIPDPPSFQVVTMPGTPAFEPNSTTIPWAYETSLDVQWSHAMAPGANIVLVVAASDSDEDLTTALDFALDRSLGQVVSMSFGESEYDMDAPAVDGWEKAFQKARRKHVTLFACSGDQGSTVTENRDDSGYVYAFPNVSYPASSPHVTGVGGTNLHFGVDGHADPSGSYLGETAWNDEAQGIAGAGGGGVSALFREPGYQRSGLPEAVQEKLNGYRGVPDVAYSAGVVGGVVAYVGFPGVATGFYVFGGTSTGSPQWAGILSDINEALGRPSGFINRKLYALGRTGVAGGLFHDVTEGNNEFCFDLYPTGQPGCVPGYSADPGWDLTTGFGTPHFGRLGWLLSDRDDGGSDGE
jgi:subtilase family serine protease